MKTYEVEFTYDRRKVKPVMSCIVEASCPMEAKAIARQYALNHWDSGMPAEGDGSGAADAGTPGAGRG